MKSKLICALLLALGPIVAQESEPPAKVNQQFGYVSAGLGPFPIPLPVFSAGYRAQSGHHGADLSLQVSTVVVVTELKTNLLYHYYFKPSLASEFYVGGGVGPSVFLGNGTRVAISPEFVFGKQYRNETDDLRFFQMQVSFPTIPLQHKYYHYEILKFPLVVFSYGLGF